MPESVSFSRRTFRANELELMRQIAEEFEARGVTEIARTICELLRWKRSGGGLKNHEGRRLLERLAAEGFLPLPDLRKREEGVRRASTYPQHPGSLHGWNALHASANRWSWF
jgi:hypothetical protein